MCNIISFIWGASKLLGAGYTLPDEDATGKVTASVSPSLSSDHVRHECSDPSDPIAIAVPSEPCPIPPLGFLRRAKSADVDRIAEIYCAGIDNNDTLRWYVPYHRSNPTDILVNARRLFAEELRAQGSVVLVIEDKYDPGELTVTGPRISRIDGLANPSAGDTVAVGFAVWSMRSTHSRYGQFAVESPCTHVAHSLSPGRLPPRSCRPTGRTSISATRETLYELCFHTRPASRTPSISRTWSRKEVGGVGNEDGGDGQGRAVSPRNGSRCQTIC